MGQVVPLCHVCWGYKDISACRAQCCLSLAQPYAAAWLIFLEMLRYLKGVNEME